MKRLSYKQLLEAYEKAVELSLEADFIKLIKKEIKWRDSSYCRGKLNN